MDYTKYTVRQLNYIMALRACMGVFGIHSQLNQGVNHEHNSIRIRK